MTTKVGINGFGRIGKLVFQAFVERFGKDFEVVGINDLTAPKALAHLLKFDTVQRGMRHDHKITADDNNIIVDGRSIPVFKEKNPGMIPWEKVGAQIVIESTGVFRDVEKDGKPGYDTHLKQKSVKKVILTVPAKNEEAIRTVIMGVNEEALTATDSCISNASCTTNCLAPLVKVLDAEYGIVSGFMTTIHSYTNDQKVVDQIHEDPRRARAAGCNIIPTSTGAAKALGLVLPQVKGKLHGYAIRVPTPTGSVVDLTVNLAKAPSEDADKVKDAVNALMKKAADGAMKGILEYCEDEIVSSDIIHNPASSIFDSKCTLTLKKDPKCIKLVSWYDNEWGYSNRVCELSKLIVARGYLK